MGKELKVMNFDKKQKLLDFVNDHPNKVIIVSISTSQMSHNYNHFLWYYEEGHKQS